MRVAFYGLMVRGWCLFMVPLVSAMLSWILGG